MSSNRCVVHRLGLMPYKQAWDLQESLAGEIAARQRPPGLLLLEHPHTFTFGRRGHRDHLLWDEALLQQRGVTTYWVDRGGDITYHGPGQLVGYPLLPLAIDGLIYRHGEGLPSIPKADYVGYIRRLEHALIDTLHKFDVVGQQAEGLSGVWVKNSQGKLSKIAAIGVKVDARGISRHGFALNIDPDMSYWEGIIGCGLRDHSSIALVELITRPPSMEQVIQAFIMSFGKVFNFEMIDEEN